MFSILFHGWRWCESLPCNAILFLFLGEWEKCAKSEGISSKDPSGRHKAKSTLSN